FVLFVMALLGVTALASGQPVTNLTGRVTDPQKSPVPGATITIRSNATGATWTVTSGPDGRFSVPMLPPGEYSADVQLAGFARWEANPIALQAGQDRF